MDLAREDTERIGAREGDEVNRVKWRNFCAVVTPNREKSKEEKEEEEGLNNSY